jgi:proteic killer suppression protein
MIVSFRHKGLKLLHEKSDRSKIRADLVDKVERLLSLLEQAEQPADVDLPGCGLHPLKGNLKGSWSLTVSRNHRIVFRMAGRNVCDVDLIDYH